MPLVPAELEALAQRGTISASDAVWLQEQEAAEQEAASEDQQETVSTFNLFTTASDSDSEGSDGNGLVRQAWSCQVGMLGTPAPPE